MYFIYAIKSLDKNFIYVGLTDHVIRRFHQYNSGYEKSTKAFAPFMLIYTEEFENRTQAREREKHFKTANGKRNLIPVLSKKNNMAEHLEMLAKVNAGIFRIA